MLSYSFVKCISLAKSIWTCSLLNTAQYVILSIVLRHNTTSNTERIIIFTQFKLTMFYCHFMRWSIEKRYSVSHETENIWGCLCVKKCNVCPGSFSFLALPLLVKSCTTTEMPNLSLRPKQNWHGNNDHFQSLHCCFTPCVNGYAFALYASGWW